MLCLSSPPPPPPPHTHTHNTHNTHAHTCKHKHTLQIKAKAAENAKDDDKTKRMTGKQYFLQERTEAATEVCGWV